MKKNLPQALNALNEIKGWNDSDMYLFMADGHVTFALSTFKSRQKKIKELETILLSLSKNKI